MKFCRLPPEVEADVQRLLRYLRRAKAVEVFLTWQNGRAHLSDVGKQSDRIGRYVVRMSAVPEDLAEMMRDDVEHAIALAKQPRGRAA